MGAIVSSESAYAGKVNLAVERRFAMSGELLLGHVSVLIKKKMPAAKAKPLKVALIGQAVFAGLEQGAVCPMSSEHLPDEARKELSRWEYTLQEDTLATPGSTPTPSELGPGTHVFPFAVRLPPTATLAVEVKERDGAKAVSVRPAEHQLLLQASCDGRRHTYALCVLSVAGERLLEAAAPNTKTRLGADELHRTSSRGTTTKKPSSALSRASRGEAPSAHAATQTEWARRGRPSHSARLTYTTW